jgi:transposase InsO family protein
VNRKRIARLRRREGLKVPKKQRKRRRLGSAENGILLHAPTGANDVWSYDFVSDQTEDARTLKMLVVVDEYTREALALEVGRNFTSNDVVAVLEYLVEVRGAPRHIRSDNGPEFIAHRVRDWLARAEIKTLFIEPGSPWQNAYVESFNSRLRDELLNCELFTTLAEARVMLEDHRLDYNHRRPHSSLDYKTPAAFAARLREVDSAPALRAYAPSPSRELTPV